MSPQNTQDAARRDSVSAHARGRGVRRAVLKRRTNLNRGGQGPPQSSGQTPSPQPDPTCTPHDRAVTRTDGNSGAFNREPEQRRRSQGKRWRRPQRQLSSR